MVFGTALISSQTDMVRVLMLIVNQFVFCFIRGIILVLGLLFFFLKKEKIRLLIEASSPRRVEAWVDVGGQLTFE